MKKDNKSEPFTLVETNGQLTRFYTDNAHVGWLAFDTEFIPEKYYKYRLCVISVSTARGNYIIDVLKLKTIAPFIKIIEAPYILKITHAGENDYRILVNDYGARPVNIFDTQLSYGFLQYDYPVGLQTLLVRRVRIKLDKGALRSDWEKRPLTVEQCRYVIRDVIYLHPLMLSLKRQLKKAGKLDWAEQENRQLEDLDYYKRDPLDFLNTVQVSQMTPQQRVFLMRMHLWRHLEAEKENCPVTQLLKTRVLNTIVQKISSGESALLKDRTLPTRFIRQHLETFKRFYREAISPHEQELLNRVTGASGISPKIAIVTDMLHQLVKYKGFLHRVSPNLILPSKELHRMKTDKDYLPTALTQGWRKELLGKDLLKLLENRKNFDITIKKDKFTLTEKPKRSTFFKNLFSNIKGPQNAALRNDSAAKHESNRRTKKRK
jgi:ribonuclease D